MSIKCSIIVPVFNEEPVIDAFINSLEGALDQSRYPCEFIFIDDGSSDSTWEILKKHSLSSPRLRAVRFTRNFGKEAAIQAGLEMVKGQIAVIMDADLQHPPDLLPQMISLWENEGYNVVEGVKTFRQKESLLNKAGSAFFYKAMKALTGFDIRRDTDYKLLDRKAIEAYLSMKEKSRFFRALIPFLGLKTAKVPFSPQERIGGQTKFSFMKLLTMGMRAITSFSSFPLHIITLLGILTLIFSFFLGIQTIYMKISGKSVEGFTTVILLILTIGSILMLALGVIGEYIARIFEEVKNRPSFVIAETINTAKEEKENVQ